MSRKPSQLPHWALHCLLQILQKAEIGGTGVAFARPRAAAYPTAEFSSANTGKHNVGHHTCKASWSGLCPQFLQLIAEALRPLTTRAAPCQQQIPFAQMLRKAPLYPTIGCPPFRLHLQFLQLIAEALRPLGPRAAFYLAAAVSDFFVPWADMVRLI